MPGMFAETICLPRQVKRNPTVLIYFEMVETSLSFLHSVIFNSRHVDVNAVPDKPQPICCISEIFSLFYIKKYLLMCYLPEGKGLTYLGSCL